MLTTGISILLAVVSLLVTTFLFPYVLSFAKRHKIVDNPNVRKLQRVPVPVMGGTAVSGGLAVAVLAAYLLCMDTRLILALVLLAVMYAVGTWDDVKDVSASLRFLIECGVVWSAIVLLDVEINDLHGLWGIHEIPDRWGVLLSLVAGVGIMNAVNLIDGVDGLCSSFCIMACTAFAVVFYIAGDMTMFALALFGICATIPFFFHNVFGRTSKMFLGDGGSLMLGTLLMLFTFSALTHGGPCAGAFGGRGLSLVALTTAIMAVPVFDTLKVMTFRMARGKSPFTPDKTHLHHLFIDMFFSHLFTTWIIVLYNIFIVAALLGSWALGASVDLQFYIVAGLALLFTWGFYFFMEWQHGMNDGEGSGLFRQWCRRGFATNLTATKGWQLIRRIVDSRLFSGVVPPQDDDEPAETGQAPVDPRIR